MADTQNAAPARTGRRTIYRGKEPQRKPLIWLAVGLVGTCVIGLLMRGPEPFILAAMFLSPICVFAYYLFEIWGRQRIRRVDLDGGDLVLFAGFQKGRRVSLAYLTKWRLQNITLYMTGAGYDPNSATHQTMDIGVKGPAITAHESQTGKRLELVLEDAKVDIEGFRIFAPDAVAKLEQRAAGKGKAHIRFTKMAVGR